MIKEYIKQLEIAKQIYWEKEHKATHPDTKNFYRGMEHSVLCCINDLKNILLIDKTKEKNNENLFTKA